MAVRGRTSGGTDGTGGGRSRGGDEDDAQAAITEEATRPFQGFPSGAAAIDGLGEDAPVTLINLHLSKHRISLPHAFKQTKAGYAMQRVEARAFATLTPEWAKASNVKPVTVADARRVLETQESKTIRIGARVIARPPKIVVAPPHGDCRNRAKFRAFDREWETCPHGNCPHHGEARYPWSVTQMQILIGRLETAPAIRAIIERVDTRVAVVLWGQQIIEQRAEAKRKRMGFGTAAVAAAVN